MKIDALMTRDVMACRPWDSGLRAAQLMWDFDCGALPVTDASGRLLGMLTDRDLCMAAYLQGKRLDELRVQDVIARAAIVCRRDDPVSAAHSLMRQYQIRRVPVVDDQGRLCGILSLADLLRDAVHVQRHDVHLEAVRTSAAIHEARRKPEPRSALPASETRRKPRSTVTEEAEAQVVVDRQTDLEC